MIPNILGILSDSNDDATSAESRKDSAPVGPKSLSRRKSTTHSKRLKAKRKASRLR